MSRPYLEIERELRVAPKRWLVTGGAGFIGSHLVERLLVLGQEVVALDNLSTGYRENIEDIRSHVGEAWKRFSFIEGDIADFQTCERAVTGVDYVLHQAALGSVPRSILEPLQSHRSNVDGFLNMLIAARDAKVQGFVYASSSSVYGDNEALPKVEANTGNALSPYAVTKQVNELYAANFRFVYELPTVGLRYFNVFGSRQDPLGAYAAVIPRWIGALLSGKPCVIFGDGETSRDFCFIENVLQANILAAVHCGQKQMPRAVNVAAEEKTSLKELYVLIAAEIAAACGGMKVPPVLFEAERKGDIRHSLADLTLAKQFLGYAPAVSVSEGMKSTVEWFAARNVK